jgi:hypothetical protein
MTKVLQATMLFYPNKIITIILCKTKKNYVYPYNELEKNLYKIGEFLRDLHSSINYV